MIEDMFIKDFTADSNLLWYLGAAVFVYAAEWLSEDPESIFAWVRK